MAERTIAEATGRYVTVQIDTASFAGDDNALMYADLRGANPVALAIRRICETQTRRDIFRHIIFSSILLCNQKAGDRQVFLKRECLFVCCSFADKRDHLDWKEFSIFFSDGTDSKQLLGQL